MFFRRLSFATIALAFTLGPALADENPTITGKTPPTASEASFVTAMQADLTKRFPNPAAAEAAGFFRYTNADDTGAISYTNLKWQSSDAHSPSQLWFSKTGELLGADYSVLNTGAGRPKLWGIAPGRWAEFDEHIHWITKNRKTGAMGYDLYAFPKKFKAAGGDMKDPQAATLVKMHRAKSTAEVAKIFDFPSIWDLIVWVKPNPSGAFAEKNPTVKV